MSEKIYRKVKNITKMSRLKTNFIYDAIYQFLILIIPIITTPYVARTIGPTGVGIYSYTYSVVSYFMMFALLGTSTYGNREVSKVKDDKDKLNYTFTSIYLLQLIVTILVSLIYLTYIFIFDSEYFTINLIQFLYIISVAFNITWLFNGLQKFKFTITRSIVIKICTFLMIFIFVRTENDLWKYILILALSTLLNQAILWPFLKKEVKFVKVKFKDLIKHLKPILILFIPVIATSIYRVMDKIMVGNIANVTEVGYYENAEKMLNIVLNVVNALGTVTLPQMTYLYANNKMGEYHTILKKSIILIFFMVFPVIFGFLLTADNLTVIYLGDKFIKSGALLKILSISLLFSPLANIIRMQLLIPKGKDKAYIVSVIMGALINLILNLILIKRYEAIGASISTIIAEMSVLLIQYYFIRNELHLKDYIADIIKFAIKSFIMFIIVYLVGNLINDVVVKLVMQVITGVTVYGILNLKYINSQVNIKKMLKIKTKNADSN